MALTTRKPDPSLVPECWRRSSPGQDSVRVASGRVVAKVFRTSDGRWGWHVDTLERSTGGDALRNEPVARRAADKVLRGHGYVF